MEQTPKPAGSPAVAPKPKSKNMLLAVIIVVILVVVGVGVYILLQKPAVTAQETLTIWDTGGTCLQTASPADCGFKAPSGSPNVTISVGTTVQWKNTGGSPHTATSCDSSHTSGNSLGCPTADASALPSFDTGSISNGSTSTIITFSQAGTYYYYCTIHPWMHGVIIVT